MTAKETAVGTDLLQTVIVETNQLEVFVVLLAKILRKLYLRVLETYRGNQHIAVVYLTFFLKFKFPLRRLFFLFGISLVIFLFEVKDLVHNHVLFEILNLSVFEIKNFLVFFTGELLARSNETGKTSFANGFSTIEQEGFALFVVEFILAELANEHDLHLFEFKYVLTF